MIDILFIKFVMYRLSKIIIPFLIFYLVTLSNADLESENETFLENAFMYIVQYLDLHTYEDLIKNYKTVVSILKENVIALNYTCGRDLLLVHEAIIAQEMWAMKMVDAWSKISSGILEGNIINLGMYDQCLAVNGQIQDIQIRGRHCIYTINVPMTNISFQPSLSVCVPTSCSVDDVGKLITEVFNQSKELSIDMKDFQINVPNVVCSRNEMEPWDTGFIICLFIFIVYFGFLIICTFCDLVYRRIDDEFHTRRVLINLSKFSLIKNAAAILNTNVKEGNIPSIHGLKFLSMAWVLLGHEYVLQFIAPNINNFHVYNWTVSWNSLYIYSATFAVDTFFTISGFLLGYLFLKQIPKQKKFNIPVFYLHRYFRIAPPVFVLIAIAIFFLPKMADGPRWAIVLQMFMSNCDKEWWSTALFIQNFFPVEKTMCLPHLWYLAVDMQLFWISPIILLLLYKKPKIGFFMIALLILITIIVTSLTIGINKYSMSISLQLNKKIEELGFMFNDVYVKPYCRAIPWLMGILLGYEVANKKRRLRKWIVYIGWLLAVVFFTYCILYTRYFMTPDYQYDMVNEIIFANTSKIFWSLAICWIIYSSIYQRAGFISTFLSCKFFIPLSRLSYCVYLIHMVFILIQIARLRVPRYFSDYYAFNLFLSDLCLSIIIAFFYSLLFESPLLVLERMLLKRYRESHNESKKERKLSSIDDISVNKYKINI